jgi:hypothetical protein
MRPYWRRRAFVLPILVGAWPPTSSLIGSQRNTQELQSTDAAKGIHIRGNFVNNQALNTGAGARGGVLRILNVNASVTLDGLFKNNFADERGAVMAVNWVSAVRWKKKEDSHNAGFAVLSCSLQTRFIGLLLFQSISLPSTR